MILQGSFAVIAKSEAMFADTMAMSVDALTYLFNLLAERMKYNTPLFCRTDGLSPEDIAKRRKEIRLYFEFIPPIISVSALIIVSVQAFVDALNTIISDGERTTSNNEPEPNVDLMLFFSALNLGLDIMNVTCFAKAKNFSLGGMTGLGQGGEQEDITTGLSSDEENSDNNDCCLCEGVELYEGTRETEKLIESKSCSTLKENYGSQEACCGKYDREDEISLIGSNVEEAHSTQVDIDDCISVGSSHDSDISADISDSSAEIFNLNMCSAYTVSFLEFDILYYAIL